MLEDVESSTLSSSQKRLFEHLFSNDIPMLDLRAPIEFAKGAFPTSINIPLMTDEQRAKVGTRYKQQGQEAAIKLGHELVSGATKDRLIQQWTAFHQQHPMGYLYCFRGGLRSRTVHDWLAAEGVDIPRIEGGYKALRRYLIDSLQANVLDKQWYVVGGKTGTAKTAYIQQFKAHIDLEGLANHRGSSFGRRATEQPSVIDFENAIAIELQQKAELSTAFVLEDEGVVIGRCSMPLPVREALQTSPLLILEKSFEERVETILNDYVIGLSQEYQTAFADEGRSRYVQSMLDALQRIRKRLGGQRYLEINAILEKALLSDDMNLHRDWIIRLMKEYYDPMYEYQINNKSDRIIMQGSEIELTEFLNEQGLEEA